MPVGSAAFCLLRSATATTTTATATPTKACAMHAVSVGFYLLRSATVTTTTATAQLTKGALVSETTHALAASTQETAQPAHKAA